MAPVKDIELNINLLFSKGIRSTLAEISSTSTRGTRALFLVNLTIPAENLGVGNKSTERFPSITALSPVICENLCATIALCLFQSSV